MITITAAKYTSAEVRGLIEGNPATPWKKQYIYYIPKISSPSTNIYATLGDLVVALEAYLAKEEDVKDDQPALAKRRGNVNTNAAIQRSPIDIQKVPLKDRPAMAALIANSAHADLQDRGKHQTDPETASACGKATAREYYIRGADGTRAVKRSESGKSTFYYSDDHTAKTYKYVLVT